MAVEQLASMAIPRASPRRETNSWGLGHPSGGCCLYRHGAPMSFRRLAHEWFKGDEGVLVARFGPAGGGEVFCRWLLTELCGDVTIEARAHATSKVYRVVSQSVEVWDTTKAELLQVASERSGLRQLFVISDRVGISTIPNTKAPSRIIDADLLDLRCDYQALLASTGVSAPAAFDVAQLFSPATRLADELAQLQSIPRDLVGYFQRSSIVRELLREVAGSDFRLLELGRVLLLLRPQEIELSDEWSELASVLCGRTCSLADVSRALLDFPWLFAVHSNDARQSVRPRNQLARFLLRGLVPITGSEHFALYNALRSRAKATLSSRDSADSFVARQLPRQAMASFALEDLFKDALSVLCSDPTALVREIERDPMLVLHPGAKTVLLCAHRLQQGVSRASSLELSALRIGLNEFASAISRLLPGRPWRAEWTRAQPVHANRIIFHRSAPALAFAAPPSATCGVVGTSDGSAWMVSPYKAPTCLWSQVGSAGEVRAVGLYEASDGQKIAALATSDQQVVTVSCDTGEELWTNRTDHEAPLSALAVGHDEECPLLATSGVDGIIRVVELVTGLPAARNEGYYRHEVAGRGVEVRCMQFLRTPDGWRLLFGAVDGCVGLLDPCSGVLLVHQPVANAVLNGISAIIENGEILAAIGASDGAVYAIRLLEKPSLIPRTDVSRVLTRHRGSVNAVLLRQWDGALAVLAASSDGTWSLSRFDGTDSSERLEGHFGPIWSIGELQSDGVTLVATVGGDGCCRVWVPEAVTQESLLLEKPTRHSGSVTAVAMQSFNSELFVWTGGADGEVRVWSTSGTVTGRPLARNQVPIRALLVAEGDANGCITVFSGSARGELYRTESRRGHVVRQALLGIVHDGITCLASTYVAQRHVLVSGGVDGAITIWDAAVQKPLATASVTRHGAVAAACAIDTGSDVPLLATGGQDGSVTFRRVEPLDELWRCDFDAPIMAIATLPFHSAGLVIGLASGSIYFIRDARRSSDEWALLGRHDADVTGLAAFVIGGRLVVASCGLDRQLRIWDLSTRLVLQEIELDGLALDLSAASPHVAVATTAGAAVFSLNEDPLLLASRSQ